MSALEEVLLVQIQAAGLPEPVREFRFAPPRMWRWDISWPEVRLAVEVDGGTQTRPRRVGGRWYVLVSGHNSGNGIENQCAKLNEAMLTGWRVIRVTRAMIEDRRALTAIRRAWNMEEINGRDD